MDDSDDTEIRLSPAQRKLLLAAQMRQTARTLRTAGEALEALSEAADPDEGLRAEEAREAVAAAFEDVDLLWVLQWGREVSPAGTLVGVERVGQRLVAVN